MSGITLEDNPVEVKTHPVRLRERRQITLPQAVQEHLKVTEGDILNLVEVGEMIFLTPRQLQVPRLGDKIVTLMGKEGVSLADLLAGLEEERQTKRQTHA